MNKYDIFRLVLNAFELAAFVSGLICWNKLKNSFWKWFVLYLGIIVTGEMLAEYLFMVRKISNQWIYTWIIIPLEFLFFYRLFGVHLKDTKYKNAYIFITILYCIFFAFDMGYLRYRQFTFSSFSYMTGTIMLLLLVILYFIKLIKAEDILGFKRNIMFWVCSGLLVFFLGSLPFYGLWNTLRFELPKVFNTYWMIQLIFDCLMYIFFSIGMIWGKLK